LFRAVLVAVAVCVPLVPVAIGLLGIGTTSTEALTARIRPLAQIPSATSAIAATPRPKPVPHVDAAMVAVVRRPTRLAVSPGGATLASQPLTTPFGSRVVLLVRRERGNWLGVATPLAGNGRLGWIRRSDVIEARVDWRIEVSLVAGRLTVLHDHRVVQRWSVAIGKPGAPTPTGVFGVTDLLRTNDPGGPYGCCIVALSALAPHAIQGWGGGNRVAIHATPETGTIGQAASHGCLRLLPANARWLMLHVPLGTPVAIYAS
jgi:hypothetical protein